MHSLMNFNESFQVHAKISIPFRESLNADC